jgi:hypothetical protein
LANLSVWPAAVKAAPYISYCYFCKSARPKKPKAISLQKEEREREIERKRERETERERGLARERELKRELEREIERVCVCGCV